MDGEHPLTRQMRLAEVGPHGQARIAAAELTIPAGEGAAAELAYLCRAGVERVTLTSRAASTPFQHASSFRHAEARAFAAGSWRALAELRKVLALNSP